MAIEPQAPPKPGLFDRAEVIENEIPAYRAIQPLAVTSLLLGIVAAFAFANVWFGIAAILAVVTGLWADWKIRKFPDVFTGRGLAQAGVAMGIVFGVSSVTISYVQDAILKREATTFGKNYVNVLKKGNLAEAIWYRLPPDARRTNVPEEVLKKMTASSKDAMSVEAHIGPTKALLARLERPGSDLHFEAIEKTAYSELTRIGLVVLAIHGGALPNEPEEEFALLEVKSDPTAKVPGWYIGDVVYPYKRNTAEVKAKKPKNDDGHGHAH